MRIIGIDIGTTTISAAVVDGESGKAVDAYTVNNHAFIKTSGSWESIQDTSVIIRYALDLIGSIAGRYSDVGAIGITGQMHGIVYTDAKGEAVSPLFTWQDKRCDLPYKEHLTYCEYIKAVTKRDVASGYGLATHFYNLKNGLVPPGTSKVCTISDYLAMKLTGRSAPLVHSSNAASLGCFDAEKGEFSSACLATLGIDASILPEITNQCEVAGEFSRIPVSVAIGDNQASFLGSVSKPDQSILVNIGTGSQISFMTREVTACGLDVRPYMAGNYLLVGSSLCGGRAYAILEKLFRSIAVGAGAEEKSLFPMMNRLAEEAFNSDNHLDISTLFSGTRAKPTARGSIKNIDSNNLTAGQLVYGTLCGIVNELYGFYKEAEGSLDTKPLYLVASGNGVRRNRALQRILAETFHMEVSIPENIEEAAFGAALFSILSARIRPDIPAVNEFVKYAKS